MTRRSGLEDGLKEYGEGWYSKMAEIWRDRLDLLDFRPEHTGRLRESVRGLARRISPAESMFRFGFVYYGIYVDMGTGRGYRRGNGGDLEFLGKEYRKAHRLGRARVKTQWLSRSWAISRRRIIEKYAELIGKTFTGAFDTLK